MKISTEEKSYLQKTYITDPLLLTNLNAEQVVLTLYDRKDYSLFLPMLKEVIKLGGKITKYHTVWRFRQKAFLKEYVEFMSHQRSISRTTAENLICKLFVNSLYGRYGINLLDFKDIRICTEKEYAFDLINNPLFESFKIIDEGMALCETRKSKVCYNNNFIVQAAILDLSKVLLYEIVYGFKNQLKDRVNLLYVDTDGFVMKIQTDDLYKDLKSIHVNGEEILICS
jgi:hypothetical protein